MKATTKWAFGVATSAAIAIGTCSVNRGAAIAADYSAHKQAGAADHQAIVDTAERLSRIEAKIDRLLSTCPR